MARPLALLRLAMAGAVLVGLVACRSSDRLLQEHQKKFESLGATATTVAGAWLEGQVSGTYARTALEQTFLLLQQESASLASQPEALADPRAGQLSERAERFSRVLALITRDVEARDASALRQHLPQIPFAPGSRP